MEKKEYWVECISLAADECGLVLTKEQLACLAESAAMGHAHYGMAFYSPSSSERIESIEDDYKKKLDALQRKFDAYTADSESAVKRALRMRDDDIASIGRGGVVTGF